MHSQATHAARNSMGRHRDMAGASMAEVQWDRWTTGPPEDLGPPYRMTQSADDLDPLVSCCGCLPCAWERLIWQCIMSQVKLLGSKIYGECELCDDLVALSHPLHESLMQLVMGVLCRQPPDR